MVSTGGKKIKKRKGIKTLLFILAPLLVLALYYKLRPVVAEKVSNYKDEQQYKVYRSPVLERLNVTLSDGSKIILDTNSVLKVPHQFGTANRRLILLGAAYFEVSANEKPFFLETADLKTTITAGTFFMSAYPQEGGEQIELLSGRMTVQKAYTSQTDTIPEDLLPGEMVMINRSVDLMEKEKFSITERQGWLKVEPRSTGKP